MAEVTRGDQTNRKDDTVLLVDWATNPATDLGNLLTNLSTGFAVAYELNSARTALTSPRELTAKFDATNTNAGYLMNHGNTANTSYGWRMRVNGSGNIICEDDTNGEIFNVALPDVDGTTRTYVAQWCTRSNPLTTGAADAYRSVLWLHCDTGTMAIHHADHAVPPIDATEELALGGHYDGAAPSNTYDGTMYWFRIGERFHSTTEAYGDWDTAFTDPANTGQSYVQLSPLPERAGIEDEIAGGQLLYAQIAHIRNAMRLLSPIISEEYVAPPALQDDLTDTVHTAYVIAQPDDSEYQAHLGLLRERIVPACSDLWVKVWVQLYNTGAAPDQLEVRCYTDRVPPGHPNADPDLRYVTLTFTTNDTSSGPPSMQEGALPLILHDDEWVWLWLAFSTNDGAASANNRFKVWGWTVEPRVVDVADVNKFPPMVLPP